jgi:hypothetical protein
MPKVRALLEEARHIANASHDQKTLAETEWNLAQITASSWNNPKSALPYGLSALELARATNDKELEARSLLAVGLIHFAEGNFLEILSYLEASLALYAALGDGDASSRGDSHLSSC